MVKDSSCPWLIQISSSIFSNWDSLCYNWVLCLYCVREKHMSKESKLTNELWKQEEKKKKRGNGKEGRQNPPWKRCDNFLVSQRTDTFPLCQSLRGAALSPAQSTVEQQILVHRGTSWGREMPGQWSDPPGAVNSHRRWWWGLGITIAPMTSPMPIKSSLGSKSNQERCQQNRKKSVS